MPCNRRAVRPGFDAGKIVDAMSKLHIAALRGDLTTIRALIRAGADLNEHLPGIGITPMFVAIHENNLQMVRVLIRAGADINAKVTNQETPLFWGVYSGRIEIVRFLLDNGADINARRLNYNSALHDAVDCSFADIAELLIDRGLDVNVRNDRDETALHIAAQYHKKEIVRLLLRKGAEVNATACGRIHDCKTGKRDREIGSNVTALYLACCKSQLGIVDMLIQAGADVNIGTSVGHAALHWASKYGSLELVRMLLKAKADVNAITNISETPLFLATREGKTDIVATLLGVEGININPIMESGMTPLVTATYDGNLEIVKLLIAKGAPINAEVKLHTDRDLGLISPLVSAVVMRRDDVAEFLIQNGANIRKDSRGASPLSQACGEQGFSPKIGKLLINKGCNVNEFDPNGMTPLHHNAIANGDLVENTKFLVEHGANPNARCTNQGTPLHYAANKGNMKVVEYLVTKAREINPVMSNFHTPLISAVKNGNLEIAKILLKSGADPNSQDSALWTPLHIAAVLRQLEIVKLLLKYKAAVNLKDSLQGSTPLFSAAENGDEKLVILLLDSNADPNAANKFGVMPIHIASSAGKVGMVRALLEKGAYFDVTAATNNYSGPPLKLAQNSKNVEVITILELVEQLFSAVVKNDTQQLRCCIQAGASVNARHASGRTALHFAVSNGNIDAINTLLANGADIRLASNTGDTPLHVAVSNKSMEMVNILLTHTKKLSFTECNCTVNAKTTDGTTVLHTAAANDSLDIIQLLFKYGAVYNPKNKAGKVPSQLATSEEIESLFCRVENFFQAVETDNLGEVVSVLQNDKSVVNVRDSDGGGTPLYWAVSKGRMGIATHLLTNGADYCLVTKKGTTPLHIAASKGNVEMVKTLLTLVKNESVEKANDFIDAQTVHGTAALHVVSTIDVAKCLLEAGATYNIRNKEDKTPLKSNPNKDVRDLLKTTQELFRGAEKGVSAVLDTLNRLEVEKFRAVANTRNAQGKTISAVAIANGHVKIASKVLEKLLKKS